VIENDNIKELFSKSLENHTSTVRPEVWNGLQAKMAAAGVSSVAATKGLSMLTKWIIGSAAVTGTAVITTIAVMNSGSEKPVEKAPAQPSGSRTEMTGESVDESPVTATNELNVAENDELPAALDEITTQHAFLRIEQPGRNGAIGDPGIPTTLPGPDPEKPVGNPFKGKVTQEPPVEPGKVVEIPVENEVPVMDMSQDAEFKAPVVHMPNVFTPNGDGSNEFYEIDFDNVPTATITFMDENNKTVYSTTDKGFKWNGTVEGDPVPDGTYACIVVYQDMNGKTHKKITLIDIRR
jgi:gliding motility-associated-like protein